MKSPKGQLIERKDGSFVLAFNNNQEMINYYYYDSNSPYGMDFVNYQSGKFDGFNNNAIVLSGPRMVSNIDAIIADLKQIGKDIENTRQNIILDELALLGQLMEKRPFPLDLMFYYQQYALYNKEDPNNFKAILFYWQKFNQELDKQGYERPDWFAQEHLRLTKAIEADNNEVLTPQNLERV